MSQLVYNQEEDINKIKKGFEMFDVENSGQINPFEIKVTMEEMNLKDKNPFIYKLISSLCARKDIKSKGGITSDEFISFLQSTISEIESREGIKTIFEVFSEYDDTIPMPKFYQTAREVGDEEGGTEIRDLVEKSKTGGKEIDFNEFYDIMKGKNPIVKYSQYSYRRRDENNRNRNRSRSQSKGRNNWLVAPRALRDAGLYFLFCLKIFKANIPFWHMKTLLQSTIIISKNFHIWQIKKRVSPLFIKPVCRQPACEPYRHPRQ